jgi:hypothetical protein
LNADAPAIAKRSADAVWLGANAAQESAKAARSANRLATIAIIISSAALLFTARHVVEAAIEALNRFASH